MRLQTVDEIELERRASGVTGASTSSTMRVRSSMPSACPRSSPCGRRSRTGASSLRFPDGLDRRGRDEAARRPDRDELLRPPRPWADRRRPVGRGAVRTRREARTRGAGRSVRGTATTAARGRRFDRLDRFARSSETCVGGDGGGRRPPLPHDHRDRRGGAARGGHVDRRPGARRSARWCSCATTSVAAR